MSGGLGQGGLLAGRERERGSERIGAAAHEHIGQTDAGSGDANAQLPGPRLGHVDVDGVKDVDRLTRALYLPGSD